MGSSGLASVDLLVVRSLDFGCGRTTTNSSDDRLADPLYKRYALAHYGDVLVVHLAILTPFTQFQKTYSFNFPSQYYYSIAHPTFYTLEIESPFSAGLTYLLLVHEFRRINQGFSCRMFQALVHLKPAAKRHRQQLWCSRRPLTLFALKRGLPALNGVLV